mgnify:CR=1 FL=1
MNAYTYLAIAICAEVIATVSMKAIKGFSTPLPLVLVIAGYATAFWMLTLVVRTIPVGVAYAVWAGMGIVMVPDALVEQDLRDGKLVALMPSYQLPSRPMHLVYAQDRHRLPKLRRFVDFAVKMWGKHSPPLTASPSPAPVFPDSAVDTAASTAPPSVDR